MLSVSRAALAVLVLLTAQPAGAQAPQAIPPSPQAPPQAPRGGAQAPQPGATPCMMRYHQTRSAECLAEVVALARGTPQAAASPGMAGFLADLLLKTPEARKSLIDQADQPLFRMALLQALVAAGLRDEVRELAARGDRPGLFESIPPEAFGVLDQMRPRANPGENDFLIGAYMASGNVERLRRILMNFSDADDGMTRDALRLGLMMGKFGPRALPPERASGDPGAALCEKYACKSNPQAMLRVGTLATGFMALGALARNDAAIDGALRGFFADDARLSGLLKSEQAAQDRYLATLAPGAGLKDNAAAAEALRLYEAFQPAEAALEAVKAIKPEAKPESAPTPRAK